MDLLSDPELSQGIDWLVWAWAFTGMFGAALWGQDFIDDIRRGRNWLAALDLVMGLVSLYWGLIYWGIFFEVVAPSVAGPVLFRPTVGLVLIVPQARSRLRREADSRDASALASMVERET